MGLLRSAAKAGFTAADLLHAPLPGPRLLIYHQVGVSTGRQMEVPKERFEKQLKWLLDQKEVVTLDDALSRWADSGSCDLVALTFDDGYVDTFEVAFPILLERGMPFTLYVSTQHIESGESRYGEEASAPLTWQMIEEMLESGLMTLGSHTHTHADLRLLDADRIEWELEECDQRLQQRLGLTPRHFAYPWGYWSDAADALVRSRYNSAVVGAPANVSELEGDPYILYRYPVQRADRFWFFKRRMSKGLLYEEKVRRRLRGHEAPPSGAG